MRSITRAWIRGAVHRNIFGHFEVLQLMGYQPIYILEVFMRRRGAKHGRQKLEFPEIARNHDMLPSGSLVHQDTFSFEIGKNYMVTNTMEMFVNRSLTFR